MPVDMSIVITVVLECPPQIKYYLRMKAQSSLPSILLLLAAVAAGQQDSEWPFYGRDSGGSKYSPLSTINRKNVKDLKVAWTYHTGDLHRPRNGRPTALETTPLFIDNTLFISTPTGRVAALNPETGVEKWSFDSKIDRDAGYGDFTNRGVATWLDPQSKQRRIFVTPIDARLIALDAATGKPCADFGKAGQVDLRLGLKNPPEELSEYQDDIAAGGDRQSGDCGLCNRRQ